MFIFFLFFFSLYEIYLKKMGKMGIIIISGTYIKKSWVKDEKNRVLISPILWKYIETFKFT